MTATQKNMRSPRVRAAIVIAGVVTLGVLLGACSSSPSAAPGSTTTAPSGSTTTTMPASATTSTTPSTPATCSTAVLGLSATAGGAAAGTTSETFTFTNTGPTACSLYGYPTLTFYGPSGAGGSGAGPKLKIYPVNGKDVSAPVTIAAGATAQFLVILSDVPVNGVGCTSVASVDVAPPGTTETLSLPLELQPCGGAVTVEPVAAPGTENA
jgi:hypothetical protein